MSRLLLVAFPLFLLITAAGLRARPATSSDAVASPAADLEQGQKAGKRETLTQEQKERLKKSAKAGFERRKAERSQLQAKLKAGNEQFVERERQKTSAENASLKTRLPAFRSATDARYDAIEREARELSRRAEKATAAERQVIERRAAALLGELRGRKPQR